MKVVVGTETGLVKVVTEGGQSKTIYGVESRGNEVRRIAIGRTPQELLITRSHCVAVYSLASGGVVKEVPCQNATIAGACFVGQAILVVLTDGTCHLHDLSKGSTSSFKVNGPISAFDSRDGLFAVGGKNNNVAVYDALSQKCVWKAKCLPHDWLEMAVPVWVTSVAFCTAGHFHYDAAKKQTPLSARITATTAYHQLQVYETNVKRRPVHHVQVGEDPLFSVLQGRHGDVVFAGASKGATYAVNAATGASVGILKPSCAGSVRGVAIHPSEPVIATVSLDRYLRLYTEVSRRQTHKLYLKQRLTALLFLPDLPEKSEDDGEEDEDDDEDWDAMPLVEDEEPKRTKRKRK